MGFAAMIVMLIRPVIIGLWAALRHRLSGLAAAVLGLIDFVSIARVRSLSAGWLHFLGNLAAVGLSLVSWLLRANNMEGAVVPVGISISVVVALILTGTGWLGGELAYRYKIGVVNDHPTAERRIG